MRRVTDARETYKVLDLALRIGEILLSSGAGAADVTATMLGVTTHLGLRNADVDVTFTLLRMSYQPDPDEMPVLLTRNITQRDLDYDDLTRTQELVDDVLQDRVDVTEARARVARINSTNHYLPRWAVVLGSGVVGGGIALILGGGVLVTAVATDRGVPDHGADADPEQAALADVLPADRGRPAGHVAGPRHRVGRPAVRPERRHLAGDHGEHRAAAVRHRLHGRDPGRAERVLHHRRGTDHRGAARHRRPDRRRLGGARARADPGREPDGGAPGRCRTVGPAAGAAGPDRGDRLGVRLRVHLLRAAARAARDRDEHPARPPRLPGGAGPAGLDAVGCGVRGRHDRAGQLRDRRPGRRTAPGRRGACAGPDAARDCSSTAG